MVPAKADWSFNRWLMKSRTLAHLLAPAVIVAVVVALVAQAPAAVAVAAPAAATIAIAVAVVVTATPRWKPAAKNLLKS